MNIELPEKLYYSIGEVAKAFEVNQSLIRFWDKEFDVQRTRIYLRRSKNLSERK